MIMDINKKIEIPAPLFDMYETVIVNWKNTDYKGKIVRRMFDLNSSEQGCWLYMVGHLETLFCEEAIEPCFQEKYR